MNKYTLKDFEAEFPNDDVCLEWILNHRYPSGVDCPVCGKVTKHHKVAKRSCYECDNCGHQVYPTAGTIFHKSSTPLKIWFQVIYRMASTRCGISAKQIERETGVTYKTAWRMFKQIRTLLGEDNRHSGEVELDETYVGGKAINMHASKRAKLTGRGTADKTAVFGIVERQGSVSAMVVPNTDRNTLIPHVESKVTKPTTVYTDEMSAYNPLTAKGFNHQIINHSESPDYLQSYVNEYSFRYNHRKDATPMFHLMLNRIRSSQ